MRQIEWHKPSGIRLTAAYAALGFAILAALVDLAMAISVAMEREGEVDTLTVMWWGLAPRLSHAFAVGALLAAWLAAAGALPTSQPHRLKLALFVALALYGTITLLAVLTTQAVLTGTWLLSGTG